MGQQKPLQKSGSACGLLQYPKRVGIPKEGPMPQFEIQKKKRLRLREEGVKVSRDTMSCSPGLHRGGVVSQSPSTSQGVFMG